MSLTARFAAVRWLGLAVALLFFSLQSVSFFHNAEHAFGKHDHAGKVCEVYQYCDNLVVDDAPPAATLTTSLAPPNFHPLPVLFSLAATNIPSAAQPRAPPVVL